MKLSNTSICKFLDWDTAFFGFHIGQILSDKLTQELIPQIDLWCRQNDIKCLYFCARSDDAKTIRLAEDNGFRLVDIRITFERDTLQKIDISNINSNNEIHLRFAVPEDAIILGAIAREVHRDSRFFYDENFPSYLSERLYEAWIKQSCAGHANVVIIAEHDHLPVGYISCHINKDQIGNISLIGVSKLIQGKGIGHTLLTYALDWFKKQRVRKITVATQGRNYPAQRLYQSHGFLTSNVELWYHRWNKISGSKP